MEFPVRRTKIVATIGPASSKPEVIRELIRGGMDVARLNFSHGKYEDHEKVIRYIREIADELNTPITILQDLQGPKIRVGNLPGDSMNLAENEMVTLVPEKDYSRQEKFIPIDYPSLAAEAQPGMQVLLADGLLEFIVKEIKGNQVSCVVKEGGRLGSRKGVNFPNLNLSLPSMTEKDLADLEFGLSQGVDWISLSFVRKADDVRELKKIISGKGYSTPVIAKIEKPQAIEHLKEIIGETNGIMVARGDLGVEISPERVPMLQKKIIEMCNRAGKPVITATQMLESMIHEPRPTRAEASDVANAIIDGTDAIMLSGETAMGSFPVKAVEMMNRICCDVESKIKFKRYPPEGDTPVVALSLATNHIGQIIPLTGIVVLTTSGRSAAFVAAERPKIPVFALTTGIRVYHGLNLLWGIKPILVKDHPTDVDTMTRLAEETLIQKGYISKGKMFLLLAGIPAKPGGTNFIRIHQT
ncbi:MAG: pyruvate kinase [Syntrophothermus sp.]